MNPALAGLASHIAALDDGRAIARWR